MDREEINRLRKTADRVRRMVVEMAYIAGKQGSHLGGSLSCVEIYTVLYNAILHIDAANSCWEERDRLLAGKEHAIMAEYAAMMEAGLIKKEELLCYKEDGNILAGHLIHPEIGLEYSSCSLGMALPVAVGFAIAAKRKKKDYLIYTVMGDGELDEGSMWEAFMCAAHYQLDNLVAIVDRNHLSSDGNTEEVMALGNLKAKFDAFGWTCVEVDGHDIEALLKAFRERTKDGRPYIIIADTIKGKGLSFVENVPKWHKDIMTKELYQQALRELGERCDEDE